VIGDRVPLEDLFGVPRPIVGMVHLLPLPGAPGWSRSMDAVVERAASDARDLEEGGVDGLLVENYGDLPFEPGSLPPATVAALTRAAGAVTSTSSLPVGVNALRNDAAASLGVAVAVGARFIRVNVHTGTIFTDQGMLEGRAHETLRLRRSLGAPVAILADVFVKHAAPPPGVELEEAARDAWERGRADALILSGPATGRPPAPDRIRRVKEALPAAPVWVGSGVTAERGAELFAAGDGAIVGSAFQTGGRAGAGVDPGRVRRLVDALRGRR